MTTESMMVRVKLAPMRVGARGKPVEWA
jgi:hypothetical protein